MNKVWLSKGGWVMSTEPFSSIIFVVANNYDHFVEDGSDLDAASKPAIGGLRIIAST
jgi:hypothetical protein